LPRNQVNVNFLNQKYEAIKRGIDWQFSYDTWVEWWGDDYQHRGKGKGKLQMCRYNDTGPYSPTNTYKATQEQNLKDFYTKGVKRKQWYNNMMKTAITRRKPVEIDNEIFESVRSAAGVLGITPEAVSWRVNSKNFPEYRWHINQEEQNNG
jgi:hypothetical protein